MKGLCTVLAAAFVALPFVASADQCAWINKEQAREAVHYAAAGIKFVDLCEPCGDTLEKVTVQTIQKSESKQTSDGVHQEIVINGEAKDIAYVYIENVLGSGEFENLATFAKCETADVSKKITLIAKPKPVKTPIKKKTK